MEMELHRQTLEGYRLILDRPLAQEETLECIVPDALPDVARIVSATGVIFLKGRQTGAGSIRLTGTAKVTVLYIPEGEQSPRSMEADLPFQCVKDDPEVQEGCRIQLDAWVSACDARDMNPRKLLIRACLNFQVQVYEREMREITSDASGETEGELEKQFLQRSDWTVAEVVEKGFVFSEVLRLPTSRPPMEQLLFTRLTLGGAEGKAIGKKLICKGEFHLTALYRSGGELLSAGFELPFSQIFELDQVIEEGEMELTVLCTSLQCDLQDGELAVNIEALAQAAVWVQNSLTLLCDAYSTGAPVDVERAGCSLQVSASWQERRETARQFCESGIPAKQVLDCCASVESLEWEQEGESLHCTTKLHVDVLYLTEDGALCSVGYSIPANCDVTASEAAECRCRCLPAGECTAVPVTGGLEVRCEVLFSWATSRSESVPCVLSIKPGVVPACQMPKPSLTIRRVGEGETLWEVAKSCGASIQDIRTVNELAEGEAEEGALLLIPVKR